MDFVNLRNKEDWKQGLWKIPTDENSKQHLYSYQGYRCEADGEDLVAIGRKIEPHLSWEI